MNDDVDVEVAGAESARQLRLEKAWTDRPDLGIAFCEEEREGDTVVYSLTVTPEWIVAIAHSSLDYNSAHNPTDRARKERGKAAFVHGVGLFAVASGFISEWAGDGARAVSTGKGTFGRPAAVGDRVFFHLEFTFLENNGKRDKYRGDCQVTNDTGSVLYLRIEGAEFFKPVG